MSYDESYENARPIAPQMGDAELLLNDVIDIIVNAPNMPCRAHHVSTATRSLVICKKPKRFCLKNCVKRGGC